MTNAEKYLKDGVDVEKIAREIDIIFQNDLNVANVEQATIKYFNSTCKPILTEDERVILRNINKIFNRIERNKFGFLILTEDGCENVGEAMHTLYAFNHLFQFIKERRRI